MANLKNYLVYRLNRLLKWEDQDALALQQLSPLIKTYLPWSVSSMRPSGVVKVLNDIVVHRRREIVECGGGISTYLIGQLLKQQGGRLTTIEHNKDWCGVLEQLMRDQGLGDVVTVVHAPLRPTKHPFQGNAEWYDEAVTAESVKGLKIDLLLVDGPPAYDAQIQFARYPAAPFFRPYFADGYTIVLDDVNRKGERAIADRWSRELGIAIKLYLIDGNIGMGHSKHDWVVA